MKKFIYIITAGLLLSACAEDFLEKQLYFYVRDLTENYVELIDTGSTGRGTNKPGDGDFDFMMRLDRAIIQNPKKLYHREQLSKRPYQNNPIYSRQPLSNFVLLPIQ